MFTRTRGVGQNSSIAVRPVSGPKRNWHSALQDASRALPSPKNRQVLERVRARAAFPLASAISIALKNFVSPPGIGRRRFSPSRREQQRGPFLLTKPSVFTLIWFNLVKSPGEGLHDLTSGSAAEAPAADPFRMTSSISVTMVLYHRTGTLCRSPCAQFLRLCEESRRSMRARCAPFFKTIRCAAYFLPLLDATPLHGGTKMEFSRTIENSRKSKKSGRVISQHASDFQPSKV